MLRFIVGPTMKPAPFDYLRPESLSEALAALAEHGDDARVIAGGQSLGAMLNMRIVAPALLIDINRLVGSRPHRPCAGALTTGALVRQADALADGRYSRERAVARAGAAACRPLPDAQPRHTGWFGRPCRSERGNSALPCYPRRRSGAALEARAAARCAAARILPFRAGDRARARRTGDRAALAVADAGRSYAFIEFSVREGDFAIVAVACVVDTEHGNLRARLRRLRRNAASRRH